MAFKVMIDDNFHYMDPEERYCAGEFESAEAAIIYCRSIVDQYLVETLASEKTRSMSPNELWESYTSFGEDPFVVATDGEERVAFSAWSYARSRCDSLCVAPSEDAVPRPQLDET